MSITQGLHRLGRTDRADSTNATSTVDFAHLPSSILDAVLPGYSFVSNLILDLFGFDVSIIVTICAFIFLANTGYAFIYQYASALFEKYLTSSITIEYYDDIYDHVLAWIADLNALKSTRSLRAQSGVETAWDDFGVDDARSPEDMTVGEFFNFNNWEARVPPRFEPHDGHHWFFWRGHYIKFRRDKETVVGGFMRGMIMDQEKIILTVLGRSTQPLKDLIVEARDRYLSRESSKTIVRRPSPKEQRGRGRQAWTKVATRPSRPMATVVLDAEQKSAILQDINEYLSPQMSRWYSDRGIPYRRGFLLHGPPGSGKTSLSFAIAGVFGLDIYCISLLEPTLSEEDLSLLFNSLPRRCVVLLEDIDSAGLHRKKTEAEEEAEAADEEKEKKEGDSSAMIAKEVAKAFKNVSDQNKRRNNPNGQNTEGISLSGLLNAIDGVASHEGRVLIMTTNFPEKLDDALIRPGRVDMKIQFTNATKDQIRQLFLRMYCSNAAKISQKPSPKPDENSSLGPNSGLEKSNSPSTGIVANVSRLLSPLAMTPPATPTEKTASQQSPTHSSRSHFYETQDKGLDALADEFAYLLPEYKFSPAEIQGFLLTRKKDPYRAVAEVAGWRDELLKSKEKGVKGTATVASNDGLASKGGLESSGDRGTKALLGSVVAEEEEVDDGKESEASQSSSSSEESGSATSVATAETSETVDTVESSDSKE